MIKDTNKEELNNEKIDFMISKINKELFLSGADWADDYKVALRKAIEALEELKTF